MITDIGRSVGDFTFYKEVPKKTVWATVAYLTMLGGLFSLAVTVAVHQNVAPRILQAADWTAKTMPTLSLNDGKLTSTVPGPLEIRHPDVPQAGLVVDTLRTEPVTPAEMSQKKLIAYLTGDAVYVLTPERLETYALGQTKGKESLVVDAAFYRSMADLLVKDLLGDLPHLEARRGPHLLARGPARQRRRRRRP
ncbi:MAG: hypothetical protein FD126_239 [Elusimicrobia bacterium]|nr:MAG: hypothetical protein FD126_239 [Elusimicrobiota bacterium]